MYLLYSILYILALAMFLPYEYLKRSPLIRKRWLMDKLGLVSFNPKKKTVWLHAVSVGEVNASVPFIKKLKSLYPEVEFIVSTITDTGQGIASERLNGTAKTIYMPFDFRYALKTAIKRIKPLIFITVETEIWPNAFRIMAEEGVPVVIVNGRLSEKSFLGYKKIKFFLHEVFKNVSLFCMQDAIYAERIVELGAQKDRVIVTGNFKFDINASGRKPLWAEDILGTTIIAGSTHSGEEDIVLDAYIRLRSKAPDLNLILAPRHPERFDEVERLVQSRGLPLLRLSRLRQGQGIKGSVLLLDVMGELFSAYSAADVVIIGGSFIRHGGQNPLEPAYWSKPIVCGPHMENFPFMKEFLMEGGAISTKAEGLYKTIKELLGDSEQRLSLGVKARELFDRNSGAVAKTINALSDFFPAKIKHGAI